MNAFHNIRVQQVNKLLKNKIKQVFMRIVNNFRLQFLIPIIGLQLFWNVTVYAQELTFSAPTTGEYNSDISIRLLPGFSTSGPFHAYIKRTGVGFGSTPSQDQNYTIVNTLKNSGFTNTNQIPGAFFPDISQVIQYVDGLGRPLQTVQTKASPLGNDIVQPMVYDSYGRQVLKYLPYAEQSGNGIYRAGAINTQAQFYGTASWDATVAPTTAPYSQTVFEASPLNRVLEQGAPGTVWQPATQRTVAAGRTVVTNQETNNFSVNYATDGYAVRRWNASFDDIHDTYKILSSQGLYDPGKLYLTITKDENWTSADGKAGTTEEYKDKEGKLILKRIFNLKDGVIETLSTHYVYDDFGDLCFVLPPAANPDGEDIDPSVLDQYCYQYNYDGRKRLAGKKIPGKGWEFMVYNKFNQLVMSQDGNQRSKPSQEATFTRYDALGRVILTGTYNFPIEYQGADLHFQMQAFIDGETQLWEERADSPTGYTSRTFPEAEPFIKDILTINYYDDYSFPGGNTYPNTGSLKTKGLLTGTKTLVLGTSNMLLTINTFDDKGRIDKLYKQNYLSGTVDAGNYDATSYVYNFENVLTGNTRTHHNGVNVTTVVNRAEYDHEGRNTKNYEQINGDDEILLNENSYNEISQLTTKTLDNGLQVTSLKYNERGWLQGSTSDQFSWKLNYHDNVNPQFNGNISAQSWGSGTSLANNFIYSYDKLNRLKSGTATGMSEIIGYDNMGNIQNLNRDGLTRTYHYNGNQLVNTTGGPETDSYQYDFNGNATVDGRNGEAITYNVLNLPETVPGLDLSYVYDASDDKLKKISHGIITDYIDGIQYTNGSIDFIQTAVGLARRNGNNYSYEYNLTDNLGNVRYTFHNNPITGQIERLQSDDYYPFGLRKSSGSPVSLNNKYLYNGKELQDELGQYDYGARFYDPVVARWNVVDPMAEQDRRTSPYAYGFDDPIRHTDPDGMFGEDVNDGEGDPPVRRYSLAKDPNGDQVGIIRNATVELKRQNPVNAFFVDLAHDVLSGTGFNAIDNAVYSEGKLSTSEKIVLGITILQALDLPASEGKGGKYSGLKEPKTVGEGLKTTPAQRARILEANKNANGGTLKSDMDGSALVAPTQSKKGVKANMNQAEVDHVQERAKGGSNSNSNLRVISKQQNLDRNKKENK